MYFILYFILYIYFIIIILLLFYFLPNFVDLKIVEHLSNEWVSGVDQAKLLNIETNKITFNSRVTSNWTAGFLFWLPCGAVEFFNDSIAGRTAKAQEEINEFEW